MLHPNQVVDELTVSTTEHSNRSSASCKKQLADRRFCFVCWGGSSPRTRQRRASSEAKWTI
ncbi:hypothetical protein GPALN_002215, partial [Globodera pallida]